MVCEDSTFIGTPNSSFLKPPATVDDDVDFFLPADDVNDVMVEDSIYIISDEEEIEDLYDDASYVTDTYDEDDYYFSDEDITEEDTYNSDGDSEFEDQIYPNPNTTDDSNSNISADKQNQAATQTDQNGTENKG